jgi:hypothetical protein
MNQAARGAAERILEHFQVRLPGSYDGRPTIQVRLFINLIGS